MSQPQSKNKILLELSEKEAIFIRMIREKYAFGRIIVVMHNGEPQTIEQTVFQRIG